MGLLLSIIGGFFSARLYSTLRPDLEQLLPTDAPSVVDLQAASQRLASVESLVVVIESEDTEASKLFVDDFAARMIQAREGLTSGVEYRITRELEFFRKRIGLYMELPELRRLTRQIEARMEYERELFNPLHIFDEVEIPEPKLDIETFQRKMGGALSAYARFPDGYYSSQDEKIRLVLLGLPSGNSALNAAKKLRTHVDQVIEVLDPKNYAPDLRVNFSGGAQNMIEEQQALFEDVALSTLVVMLFVTLVMVIYFRSLWATTAVLASLLVGTLVTFGLCYFLVDELNANSAFLGSIVIGNGINFGIILTARYLEERRKLLPHPEALRIARRFTAQATWTAAMAAGVAYGSLMLTGFRGFRQFGLIGLIGMILCWIAAFVFLPPILDWVESRRPARPRELPSWIHPLPVKRRFAVSALIRRYPRALLAISASFTLVSLATLRDLGAEVIEADLSKLRSRKSLLQGSGFYAQKVDQVLKRYLTPVVILAPTRAEANRLADRLRELQAQQGSDTLFARVQTLEDFIPQDQAAKRQLIQRIRRALDPRAISLLPSDQHALAQNLISREAMRPVTDASLPEMIRGKFREKNGELGRMIVVEPPPGPRIRERENLYRFVGELRREANASLPDAPIAGTLPLTADLLQSIQTDGPRATLFAFIAVGLVVALLFRNLASIGMTLGSLLAGVLWLAGLLLLSGQKINFLNFVALPITFGIGIDYAVNIVQRYRLEGGRNVLATIQHTGSAVALCSLTTIIGYGSLLLAQNQAFRSFGWIAILGELTCMTAAVIVLPSILLMAEQKKELAQAKRGRRVRAERDQADRPKQRPKSA